MLPDFHHLVAVDSSTPLAAPATEATAALAAEDLTPLADTLVALSLATKAKAAAVPDFHHPVAVDSSTPLAAPTAEATAAPDAGIMTPLTETPDAATPEPPVAELTTHARVTCGGPSSGSPALATVFPLAAETPLLPPDCHHCLSHHRQR